MAIQTVAELEEWYKFASDYADNNRSNARRQFDTDAAAANPLFDVAFTDEALVLFDKVLAAPAGASRPVGRP